MMMKIMYILNYIYHNLKEYIGNCDVKFYYAGITNVLYTERIFLLKMRTSNIRINDYYMDDLNKLNIKTILNFGSGDGYTSDLLRQNGFVVTDIDIKNISKTNIEPIIYDGKKLPFMDNTFDCVICNFVLHHTEYNMIPNLILEMKRVENIILISEDLNMNYIDNILCKLHLFIKNSWNSSLDVKILNDNEWKIIFDELNLRILKIYIINRLFSILYPINRIIYILR